MADTSCAGSYGERGVAAAGNLPGARCCAHTWQKKGNNGGSVLFMLGGYGYDGSGNLGYLNDLWSFDVDAKLWTWVGGSQECNQLNSKEWPATRHYAVYGFDDASDSLYLFSGLGGNVDAGDWLEDLWRIQVKPDGSGSHTAVASLLSEHARPTARYWSSFWFADGKLWFVGGDAVDKVALNDMWVFDPASVGEGEQGSADGWSLLYNRTGHDIVGVYSGAQQFPGQRENAFTSVDERDSSLWMFGGAGFGNNDTARGDLSDVWRFDTGKREWTFEGGTAGTVNDLGKCGPAGKFSSDFLPEARHAGHNVPTISPRGRMYVTMGEHNGEKDVYGDVWALQLPAVGQNRGSRLSGHRSGRSAPSVSTAVFTEHCNVCNTNATYAGPTPVPGSRFAGNAWLVAGHNTSSGEKSATQADRVFMYGGWGVDASQQQRYLSDMWVALAK
eukprot:INCI2561.2.p1 GENE.INCI2561.2~~INCI2561.2.p1  ORF type:complete len:509 (+),score=94.26 INCI2561.2:196-1527(+)